MSGRTDDTCDSKDAGNLTGETEDGRPAIGIGTETETPGIREDGSAAPATMMIRAVITVMATDMAKIQRAAMMGIVTKMGRTAAVTMAIRIGDEGDPRT